LETKENREGGKRKKRKKEISSGTQTKPPCRQRHCKEAFNREKKKGGVQTGGKGKNHRPGSFPGDKKRKNTGGKKWEVVTAYSGHPKSLMGMGQRDVKKAGNRSKGDEKGQKGE